MTSKQLTLKDLCQAINGTLTGQDRPFLSLTMDSRQVSSGALFLCMKGPQTDGHNFIPQAIQNGATSFIVHADYTIPEELKNYAWIHVSDPYLAFVQIGQLIRKMTAARVAAITGSFGKTTVKECLAHLLQQQSNTYYSPRSFNNAWGVPYTLANLPSHCTYGIFEVGMNNPGEIGPLSIQVQPHVAVITNVGAAHAANFSSTTEIAQEKSNIFQGLNKDGIALINGDQKELLSLHQAKIRQKNASILIKTFGFSDKNTYQLLSCTPSATGQTCIVSINNKTYTYHLPFVGEHWALNTLCALATADCLGANVAQAVETISSFQLLAGRGQLIPLTLQQDKADIKVTVIDESYNANPQAMTKALETLAHVSQNSKGRSIAVLGDMLELQTPKKTHADLSKEILYHNIDLVCTSGPLMQALWEALPSEKRLIQDDNPQRLGEKLLPQLKDGDTLLIKGSRGERAFTGRMNKTLGILKKHALNDCSQNFFQKQQEATTCSTT